MDCANHPGFEGDKYFGFDIDIHDAPADEPGVTYPRRPLNFAGSIPALQAGQVNVALADVTIGQSVTT